MTSMIEIKNLTFQYKHKRVFDQANMHIDDSGVYGLVAPNGTGKTTLLRLIVGLVKQSSGNILINNEKNSRSNVFKTVAYFDDASSFSGMMKGRDYVDLVAKVHDLDQSNVETMMEKLGVSTFIDKKIRTYSMGMKQRLQITLVLLVDTPIILLDEPLNGLDPTSLDIVQKAIFDLGKRGKLVIVSSHNLAELARVTDVGIFINHRHLEIEKFKDYHHLKDQYAQLLQ